MLHVETWKDNYIAAGWKSHNNNMIIIILIITLFNLQQKVAFWLNFIHDLCYRNKVCNTTTATTNTTTSTTTNDDNNNNNKTIHTIHIIQQ